MRILITCFQCNNLGGIINHAEQLAHGFIELEHEVDFCYLHPTSDRDYKPKASLKSSAPSVFPNLLVDQGKGWIGARRFAYSTQAQVDAYRRFAFDFDLIIHTVPVPPKSKETKGIGMTWFSLFDVEADQILISHDGNLRKSYPHIAYLAGAVNHLVCVHDCAHKTAEGAGFARRLIVNPQEIPLLPPTEWRNRTRGWVAPHTFKAWKRMGDLVDAARFMRPETEKHVYGAGIEYNYMTSLHKCKPQYMTEAGERHWDLAVRNRMRYHGYAAASFITQALSVMKLIIDPSHSPTYVEMGGHFNRAVVDGMLHGAIPLARTRATGSNILKPAVHYLPLPPIGTGPVAFAEVVEKALDMSSSSADVYIERNYHYAAETFDRVNVAAQYLDFLDATPINSIRVSDDIAKSCRAIIDNHYNAED